MSKVCILFFLLAGALFAESGAGDIFPATDVARSAIDWKGGYFYFAGKPVFISSGSIHYARVPRELWRDRIWRLKMMGFNCVQSYVFWNASEPKEGLWDFTDNVDLDGWLSLLQEMGMYALVRVGPYSCAEWEEGGYPSWLTVKPGMTEREMGPSVAFSDPHLNKVEAITAKHQVNHGGSVFLVQLENEHSRGWGTDVSDPYLKYLDDQARANGIEVPMFNSGLHHSQDPSGEVPFQANSCPWYSTEFWTGWIGRYGDMSPPALLEKVRGTWKIIAFGGAGYNYYMAHGGTNFGYSGSGEPPGVSYDYSAPIGEAGQFHNLYFPARRAAYFAQTFTNLLARSHNDPSFATSDQPSLRVTTRTNSQQGSFILVDHFQRKKGSSAVAAIAPTASAYHAPEVDTKGPLDTHLSIGGMVIPHRGSLQVLPEEPRTVIVGLPWTDNASFESICTNVLFHHTLGTTDYWVCYGPSGDTGEVTLRFKKTGPGPSQFDFTYPAGDTVQEIGLDSGDGHQAKLLIMNTEMTNRTWLAHDTIYVGPSFVLEDGRMEFPPDGGHATLFTASGKSEVRQEAIKVDPVPLLSNWSWRDAAPERDPSFSTTGWIQSRGPQPMQTYDSFQNRYGWYHTTLQADKAGTVSLHFAAQSGTFFPYLNGHPCPPVTLTYGQSGFLLLPGAQAGANSLTILVKASPRSKSLSATPGDMHSARGLWGGVSTEKSSTPLTISWKRWDKPIRDADGATLAAPNFDDSSWSAVKADGLSLTLPRNNSWFRGTFELTADQVDSTLEMPLFSLPKEEKPKAAPAKNNVYVNGHLIDDRVKDLSDILVPGKNTILVEIQSRLGGEQGKLAPALWHNCMLTHSPWFFRGGLDNLSETAIIGRVNNWGDFLNHTPWTKGKPPTTDQPTFWRCTFNRNQASHLYQTLGVNTTGLKAGHIWLNGHNLGESAQPYPLYMPECWIRDKDNDLVVFDMYGSAPDQVQLSRYEAFVVAGDH